MNHSITTSLKLTLLAIIVASSLSACGLFGPSPTRLDISILSSKNLNPDADGRPSPLVIRLYEFNSIDVFDNSDFFSLYDDENAVIGKHILARKEIEVKPNQRLRLRRQAKPETHYIAVIAAYRDLDNSTWRASLQIMPHKTTEITIDLGSLSVIITDDNRPAR